MQVCSPLTPIVEISFVVSQKPKLTESYFVVNLGSPRTSRLQRRTREGWPKGKYTQKMGSNFFFCHSKNTKNLKVWLKR
jgi:hypothetical protein